MQIIEQLHILWQIINVLSTKTRYINVQENSGHIYSDEGLAKTHPARQHHRVKKNPDYQIPTHYHTAHDSNWQSRYQNLWTYWFCSHLLGVWEETHEKSLWESLDTRRWCKCELGEQRKLVYARVWVGCPGIGCLWVSPYAGRSMGPPDSRNAISSVCVAFVMDWDTCGNGWSCARFQLPEKIYLSQTAVWLPLLEY